MPVLKGIGDLVFNTNSWFQEISSDGRFMWLGLVLMMAFAGIFNTLISKILKKDCATAYKFIQIFLTYFLAFTLLHYGLSKVLRMQFYQPEPNTLFTPLGFLDQDILYWSTMGVSDAYNLFLGISELIAAILIIIRYTRVMGLFLATFIMVNVVAVNFSFDISVKAFSSILLLTSILLLKPVIKVVLDFFILRKTVSLPEMPRIQIFGRNRIIHQTLIVIAIIVISVPTIKQSIYPNDSTKTPLFHGAYRVLESSDPTLKMIFVHRAGYVILQDYDFGITDYKLKINQIKRNMVLMDYDLAELTYNYKYDASQKLLYLENEQNHIIARSINWRELPALQSHFH